MTKSELFKSAHKLAKTAQKELSGSYAVYLSFYLKKENRDMLNSKVDYKKLADYIAYNDSGISASDEFISFVEANCSKLSQYFKSETEIISADAWDMVFDITDEILGE